MESDKRKDTYVLRLSAYRIRDVPRGNFERNISRRVSISGRSIVRSFDRAMGRQKMRMFQSHLPNNLIGEKVEITLTTNSKIKKWAFENAYTLVFLSIMFVLTWAVFVCSRWW